MLLPVEVLMGVGGLGALMAAQGEGRISPVTLLLFPGPLPPWAMPITPSASPSLTWFWQRDTELISPRACQAGNADASLRHW